MTSVTAAMPPLEAESTRPESRAPNGRTVLIHLAAVQAVWLGSDRVRDLLGRKLEARARLEVPPVDAGDENQRSQEEQRAADDMCDLPTVGSRVAKRCDCAGCCHEEEAKLGEPTPSMMGDPEQGGPDHSPLRLARSRRSCKRVRRCAVRSGPSGTRRSGAASQRRAQDRPRCSHVWQKARQIQARKSLQRFPPARSPTRQSGRLCGVREQGDS